MTENEKNPNPMERRDSVVRGIEKVLSFLPKDLNADQHTDKKCSDYRDDSEKHSFAPRRQRFIQVHSESKTHNGILKKLLGNLLIEIRVSLSA